MATVVGPLTAAERRSLHFTPRTIARSAPVVCYAPCGGSRAEFVYPRMHLGFAAETPPESPRLVRPVLAFHFAGELSATQLATADALERDLRARRASLCELPTGAGKTVVALALAARLGVRVLVVVHTRILLDQWLARIRTFLGETAAVVCGTERDGPETRITVGMLQTLRLRPTPHDVDYGLVVYDEVHHMCARAFSRVMLRIRPRYALGLSATVARTDGLETVLYAFFGQPDRSLGAARKQARAARVEPLALGDFGVVTHSAHNFALGRSCVVVSRLVSDLAASAARTRVLVDKCASLCAGGRRVLVLSHRRAHCAEMHAALRARGIEAALVLGGGAAQRLEGHAAVIGTVAAVSEGFDEPWLDTLVLATPMVSVVQAVGRILRRDHDALVVDAVDVAIPTCRSQHRRRCAAYRAAGHTVAAMALPDGALADEAVRAPRLDLEGDDGARTPAQVERERPHAVDPEHRTAEPGVAGGAARDDDPAVALGAGDELARAARRVHIAATRRAPRCGREPRARAFG
jgi:hypothetical protein